jgi:acetoin utilization protein AcuB
MNWPVKMFMTPDPWTVRADESAEQAGRIMQAHGFHHLPVVEGETLVGVVTERDLRLMLSLRGTGAPIRVRDAMTKQPFVVGPDAPIAGVARSMAAGRYGSAIVMDGGRVVGILSVVDALDALARLAAPRPSYAP